jgi:hypothetical protein
MPLIGAGGVPFFANFSCVTKSLLGSKPLPVKTCRAVIP